MCHGDYVFFFQAEDGIRDRTVTGVQTCALPIWFIIHSARRWCGSKGNPSLQPHPSPIHSVARFPTLSTNEREWGPPRRTTSCTLPIFSCDSRVGFDFGIRKMKENKRKISRTECPSGAGVASLVLPLTGFRNKVMMLQVPKAFL